MNAAEAGQIVEYLAAGFRTEVSTATAAVWVDHLRGVSVPVGQEAARLAVASGGSWMPTAGEFLATCRQVSRRVTDGARQLPEDTTPATPRERSRAKVEELRGLLATSSGPRVLGRPATDRPRPPRAEPLPMCGEADHRYCGSDLAKPRGAKETPSP